MNQEPKKSVEAYLADKLGFFRALSSCYAELPAVSNHLVKVVSGCQKDRCGVC